ncbi:MAG: glycoside hydrolase domain-containing protein [Chloroflexales bacterium]
MFRLPALLVLLTALLTCTLPHSDHVVPAHASASAATITQAHNVYLPVIQMSGAMLVWTESTANKVQPSTAAGAGRDIVLEGARNSYEAAQIVVTANTALTGVTMIASPLSDGAGHTISADQITFFRESAIDFANVSVTAHGNLEVPQNSPSGDSRIPDPLIPFVDPYTTPARAVGAPFTVAIGLNQPVWVDIFIPKETLAGVYQGTITVIVNGKPYTSVPLTLTVWNLILPDMNTVTTYFGMHTEPGLCNYHAGLAGIGSNTSSCWVDWTPRARTLVKRYEELAHASRIDSWPNFVVTPTNGCSPPTSWTDYDNALRPYLDGTYWSNGVPSSWFPVPFSPGTTWGAQTCTQAQYTALAAAWASHLQSTGWFTRSLAFAYDEPPPSAFPAIAQHARWMQDGNPAWKAQIMDTTAPTASNIATLGPALGIYSVCIDCYGPWWNGSTTSTTPYGRAEWPGLFAQKTQLWFYESNAQGLPYPTFATNTLLGFEPRIMLWGAWYEQATGFLLWDTTYWTKDQPWGPNSAWSKTGDGVLIYPGNHDGLLAPLGSPADVAIDGPVPSYRLKIVRAGLQDWALFKLAEQRGLATYARAQVAQVYGQMGGCTWQGCPPPVNGHFFWSADGTAMQTVRHNIAQAILSAP